MTLSFFNSLSDAAISLSMQRYSLRTQRLLRRRRLAMTKTKDVS